MRQQARSGTKPEMLLRRELFSRGLRYRVDRAPLGGMRRRADIVFGSAKVAVYVDGCFWHSCPLHATVPKNNRQWWIDKLDANVRRDRDTDQRLVEAGWRVIRVWEHEDVHAAANRVVEAVRPGTQHIDDGAS